MGGLPSSTRTGSRRKSKKTGRSRPPSDGLRRRDHRNLRLGQGDNKLNVAGVDEVMCPTALLQGLPLR